MHKWMVGRYANHDSWRTRYGNDDGRTPTVRSCTSTSLQRHEKLASRNARSRCGGGFVIQREDEQRWVGDASMPPDAAAAAADTPSATRLRLFDEPSKKSFCCALMDGNAADVVVALVSAGGGLGCSDAGVCTPSASGASSSEFNCGGWPKNLERTDKTTCWNGVIKTCRCDWLWDWCATGGTTELMCASMREASRLGRAAFATVSELFGAAWLLTLMLTFSPLILIELLISTTYCWLLRLMRDDEDEDDDDDEARAPSSALIGGADGGTYWTIIDALDDASALICGRGLKNEFMLLCIKLEKLCASSESRTRRIPAIVTASNSSILW